MIGTIIGAVVFIGVAVFAIGAFVLANTYEWRVRYQPIVQDIELQHGVEFVYAMSRKGAEKKAQKASGWPLIRILEVQRLGRYSV